MRGGDQVIPRPAQWRRGDSEVWEQRDLSALDSLASLVDRLGTYEPRERLRGPADRLRPELSRRSAVLVAIYDGADGPTMVLTKRAAHLRTHAGEISFPGGGVDPEDSDLWATARREAEEEIGLDPAVPVRVGELDRFVTGASFSLVQPIVATLPERPPLTAAPEEVDHILDVSLRELVDPLVYRREDWQFDGHWVPMHFFELVGETLWGATAQMVHNLLDIATAPT